MPLPIFACLMMCGRLVNVSIDAVATPDARRDTRFTMVNDLPHVPLTNPDYLVIAKATSRALSSQGFEEAKSAEDGNLVVVIDWMFGDPKVVYRHMGGDVGGPQVSGAAPGGKGGMPVGGSTNHAAFGFGAEAQDGAVRNWPLTVTVKGVDKAAYQANPAAPGLWSITLSSVNETDDVAAVVPQMVAAGMPYMAQNAGKSRARFGALEDSVKYVRGDIPALPPTAKP